jgi:hypothetical protein
MQLPHTTERLNDDDLDALVLVISGSEERSAWSVPAEPEDR